MYALFAMDFSETWFSAASSTRESPLLRDRCSSFPGPAAPPSMSTVCVKDLAARRRNHRNFKQASKVEQSFSSIPERGKSFTLGDGRVKLGVEIEN